jgi:hypothetical protein
MRKSRLQMSMKLSDESKHPRIELSKSSKKGLNDAKIQSLSQKKYV